MCVSSPQQTEIEYPEKGLLLTICASCTVISQCRISQAEIPLVKSLAVCVVSDVHDKFAKAPCSNLVPATVGRTTFRTQKHTHSTTSLPVQHRQPVLL